MDQVHRQFKTPAETAELLRLHKNTVYRYLREGVIKGTKLVGAYWLIPAEEIERILKEGATTSQATVAYPAEATKLTPTERMQQLTS